MSHKSGGELITLVKDNITFTTTDIPSTIDIHNAEFQMVKVHINNTKQLTISNMYLPPRDSTAKRKFINYRKTDWTQFTEDTESAFAQTTIPINIHCQYIFLQTF